MPFPIGGKTIAVSTEEERGHRGADAGKPHAPLRTWDVTDPTNPKLLYTHEVPHSASPYPGDKVRFGAHQLRERVDPDGMLYVTWFAAGLRIVDISDPAHPREKGYIIPKPGAGQKAPLTNDVAMDDRGLIYLHRQGLRPGRDRIQRVIGRSRSELGATLPWRGPGGGGIGGLRPPFLATKNADAKHRLWSEARRGGVTLQ